MQSQSKSTTDAEWTPSIPACGYLCCIEDMKTGVIHQLCRRSLLAGLHIQRDLNLPSL